MTTPDDQTPAEFAERPWQLTHGRLAEWRAANPSLGIRVVPGLTRDEALAAARALTVPSSSV